MPQIKPKPTIKKCKGTTSETKGFGCGQELSFSERNGIKTYHAQKGLGIKCRCYQNWLLSSENVIKKGIDKGKALIQKEERKKSAEEKKKLKDAVTNWKNKLQVEVQLISRLIDKGLLCLARDKFGKMAGGHLFSKGGHSQMRFNLHNLHRQSFASNSCQNDDGLLREKLAIEYGDKYLEFVKHLRSYEVPKHSSKEYRTFYYKALEISNRLKKLDQNYSIEERIKLRNEINIEIGIYQEEQCIFNKN